MLYLRIIQIFRLKELWLWLKQELFKTADQYLLIIMIWSEMLQKALLLELNVHRKI